MAKILIVDDSESLLTLLSEILIKHGFKVQTAFSKKELVLVLLSSIPDLILLDVRLGGEDGRKICRDLKANSSYKNIPVILLSGSHELLESFQEYHADDFIEKPFDMDKIIGKITGILKPGAFSD
jgi:two-component system phosphate regulon response regulator PhoB